MPIPTAPTRSRIWAKSSAWRATGCGAPARMAPVGAMGVPGPDLPRWDDIQFVTAQLHRLPLLDDAPVATGLIVGPKAARPLRLEIPLIVSDMSFGSLSEPAKIALARGAERAGTGICSGEGGMLPEEQAENTRYFYQLASARFGFAWEKVLKAQAFHFKGGQAAKTGTGGHLPGAKVRGKIAEVRGLAPGQDAISPARFPDWNSLAPIRDFAAEVRARTGGIPVGYKLSAQHIEKDIDAALEVGVDYIILDGRGGGTGAAPLLFRDNISVPTIPALARARRHLDRTRRARRDADHHRRAAHSRPISPRRWRWARTVSRSRTRRCRRSAVSACAPAIPTNARSASRRRTPDWRRGWRSRNPPFSWRLFSMPAWR